jgi:hypothetical protein
MVSSGRTGSASHPTERASIRQIRNFESWRFWLRGVRLLHAAALVAVFRTTRESKHAAEPTPPSPVDHPPSLSQSAGLLNSFQAEDQKLLLTGLLLPTLATATRPVVSDASPVPPWPFPGGNHAGMPCIHTSGATATPNPPRRGHRARLWKVYSPQQSSPPRDPRRPMPAASEHPERTLVFAGSHSLHHAREPRRSQQVSRCRRCGIAVPI